MEVRPPGLTTHFTGERSHTLALLKMLRNLEQRLQGSGFDLCHPVHTAWYNRVIQNEGLVESGALRTLPEPPLSLQDDGDADNGERRGKRSVPPSSNAVLIGNTKSVWPSFVSWLADRVEEEDRVEDVPYSTRVRSMNIVKKQYPGQYKKFAAATMTMPAGLHHTSYSGRMERGRSLPTNIIGHRLRMASHPSKGSAMLQAPQQSDDITATTATGIHFWYPCNELRIRPGSIGTTKTARSCACIPCTERGPRSGSWQSSARIATSAATAAAAPSPRRRLLVRVRYGRKN
mmetsp:Transcript_18612/g.42197  ORF Transcript_18612/g.42197 Transcript_18612/m.42197 type:complete len:289 (-) Transcript_18612:355-1221(-)